MIPTSPSLQSLNSPSRALWMHRLLAIFRDKRARLEELDLGADLNLEPLNPVKKHALPGDIEHTPMQVLRQVRHDRLHAQVWQLAFVDKILKHGRKKVGVVIDLVTLCLSVAVVANVRRRDEDVVGRGQVGLVAPVVGLVVDVA